MMNKIGLLFFIALGFSCGKKEDLDSNKAGKKFDMYQMSEMSILMEQIYVNNVQLKSRIKKGEYLGKFPNHFLDIHTAVMTQKHQRNEVFKENAKLYLDQQYKIYSDPDNAETHFNNGIDICIKCHQNACTGPIPRIKKLYIK